jgi:hypothetical protein
MPSAAASLSTGTGGLVMPLSSRRRCAARSALAGARANAFSLELVHDPRDRACCLLGNALSDEFLIEWLLAHGVRREELGGVDPKDAGELEELVNSDPVLTRFDVGERGSTHLTRRGQRLL